MFSNLKTKGFNLEDTHPTNADKLSTLLAGLGLAVALSVKTGVAAAYPDQKTWPPGVVAVCPRPIRVAENLRRRKSSSSKRFPQPTPVPKTPTQLIEISGTLKVESSTMLISISIGRNYFTKFSRVAIFVAQFPEPEFQVPIARKHR